MSASQDELYQGNEGPTNDPGHAVEHLLYDVVVQVLPWREGFLLTLVC